MANQPNFVNKGPILKIVTVLPPVGDTEIGEMFLLISDKKIYIRLTMGYFATPALIGEVDEVFREEATVADATVTTGVT